MTECGQCGPAEERPAGAAFLHHPAERLHHGYWRHTAAAQHGGQDLAVNLLRWQQHDLRQLLLRAPDLHCPEPSLTHRFQLSYLFCLFKLFKLIFYYLLMYDKL